MKRKKKKGKRLDVQIDKKKKFGEIKGKTEQKIQRTYSKTYPILGPNLKVKKGKNKSKHVQKMKENKNKLKSDEGKGRAGDDLRRE